MPSNTLLSQLS